MKIIFLAGFGVGAVMGMILAPKRGKELRTDLQEFARSRHRRQPGQTHQEHKESVPQEIGLNTVTREQLLSVYGIGPVLADRIIENRPYTKARDVVERGIIPEGTFAELEKSLLKSA